MDNFKELLFAINQLLRESEKPSPRYVKIVDQILQELLEKLRQDLVEMDSEVIYKLDLVMELVIHYFLFGV